MNELNILTNAIDEAVKALEAKNTRKPKTNRFLADKTDSDTTTRVSTPKFTLGTTTYLLQHIHILERILRPVTHYPEQHNAKADDVLILSSITRISAILPNVHIEYNNRRKSVNLAFTHIAQSGTGKNIIRYADPITRGIDNYLHDKTTEERKAFKENAFVWEQEKALAKKQNRTPDFSLDPGECPPPYLLKEMPSTTSRSQLVLAMRDNQKDGLILYSTEINTLVDALAKDCGQFIDLVCKSMENELIDQYYKIDGERIKIPNPMLSILLSGVEEHFHRLFKSLTDGGFGRFFFYVGDEDKGFRSQKSDYAANAYRDDEDFISSECLNIWKFYRQIPDLLVIFTDEQWERHTNFWQERETEFLAAFDRRYSGILNRHAFGQHRIAAILTILLDWQENSSHYLHPDFNIESMPTRIVCPDDIFSIAESMTATLFEHALSLITTKEEKKAEGVQPMTNWMWYYDILLRLDTEDNSKRGFTKKDFDEATDKSPYKSKHNSTRTRAIQSLLKNHYLTRVPRTNPFRYRITTTCRKKINKMIATARE